MLDIRILPNEKCSCGGQIGYYPNENIFKCLSCGKPYTPENTTQINYFKTTKGRAAQKRYRDKENPWRKTKAGKESLERYDKSVKGKLAKRKYYYGEKGQAAHAKHQDKVKLFKALKIWLEANPSKTLEDYLKEHPNVPTN